MKYEINYKKYKFELDSVITNDYELLNVYYKTCLIITVRFDKNYCIVGYNNECINERDERFLDDIFKTYNRDAMKKIPKIIEVLCGKYVPEFVKVTSMII